MADTPKPEKVRVRNPGHHALYNPVTGLHETPGINDRFDRNHPLVKTHPWAFATDDELAVQAAADRARTSVQIGGVEAATAAPGERRATRRTSR